VDVVGGEEQYLELELMPQQTTGCDSWKEDSEEKARKREVVRVRLLDAVSDEPLPDVEVTTEHVDYPAGGPTTDANGFIDVEPPWSEPRRISVDPPPRWSPVVVDVPEDSDGGFDVRLRPATPWAVRVVGPDGEPARFLRLFLREASGFFYWTNVEGGIGVLENTPQGRFRLEIETEHGRYVHPEPVEIPGPEVVVQVPAGGDLDLRVPELEIEYEEGSWLDRVEVRLTRLDGKVDELLVFAESLLLEDVPPGRYRVEVSAPDGRVWTTEAEVRDATTRTALAW
jgi:hypothetical protein